MPGSLALSDVLLQMSHQNPRAKFHGISHSLDSLNGLLLPRWRKRHASCRHIIRFASLDLVLWQACLRKNCSSSSLHGKAE